MLVTWKRSARRELARSKWLRTCLACGDEMAEALVKGGSLRCGTCRDEARPLDATFVEKLNRSGALF